MNIDDILDDCLERLSRGETLAECVARYRHHKDELVPLLQIAAATMRAASSVSPTPEAKSRGLSRLVSALSDLEARRSPRFGWLLWRPRVPRPLVIGLVVGLFSATMTVGTGVASSDSVPGDPLYWVKTTRENISLMLPQSDMDKARAHIGLAGERGREIKKVVSRHRSGRAEQLADRINYHLRESAGLVGITMSTSPIEMPHRRPRFRRAETAADFRGRLERNEEFLRMGLPELLARMPADDRRAVELMRRGLVLRYRTLIVAMEDESAPRGVFWARKTTRPKAR